MDDLPTEVKCLVLEACAGSSYKSLVALGATNKAYNSLFQAYGKRFLEHALAAHIGDREFVPAALLLALAPRPARSDLKTLKQLMELSKKPNEVPFEAYRSAFKIHNQVLDHCYFALFKKISKPRNRLNNVGADWGPELENWLLPAYYYALDHEFRGYTSTNMFLDIPKEPGIWDRYFGKKRIVESYPDRFTENFKLDTKISLPLDLTQAYFRRDITHIQERDDEFYPYHYDVLELIEATWEKIEEEAGEKIDMDEYDILGWGIDVLDAMFFRDTNWKYNLKSLKKFHGFREFIERGGIPGPCLWECICRNRRKEQRELAKLEHDWVMGHGMELEWALKKMHTMIADGGEAGDFVTFFGDLLVWDEEDDEDESMDEDDDDDDEDDAGDGVPDDVPLVTSSWIPTVANGGLPAPPEPRTDVQDGIPISTTESADQMAERLQSISLSELETYLASVGRFELLQDLQNSRRDYLERRIAELRAEAEANMEAGASGSSKDAERTEVSEDTTAEGSGKGKEIGKRENTA